MQSRNWIPLFLLGGLLALQSTAASAQEAIGKATSVRPQAEGSHGGPNAFRWCRAFIRRRRFEPGIVVKRICNFAITAVSVLDQNRACVSISSCTIRINLPAPSLYRRHAVRFDL